MKGRVWPGRIDVNDEIIMQEHNQLMYPFWVSFVVLYRLTSSDSNHPGCHVGGFAGQVASINEIEVNTPRCNPGSRVVVQFQHS